MRAATEKLRVPVTLRLGAVGGGKPRATAWLLQGDDADAWLAELCAWGVPLDDLRLIPLPRSPRDRSRVGALVIAPPSLADRIMPSPIAHAYVAVADGRLFIPAGTRLHPPMTPEELRAWLVLDVQVMHPSIELVGCATNELLRVADVLAPPPEVNGDWSRATPGIAVEPRLRSVRPSALPDLSQFIIESRDDIGADDAKDLPPLPEESRLRQLASNGAIGALSALGMIAGALGSLGGAAGAAGAAAAGGGGAGAAGAGGPGGGFGFSLGLGGVPRWLRQVHDWTAEQIAALRAKIEAARSRELARLMSMLEKNPDEGLRYAPPLADAGRSRGVAPPGWRLFRRDVNFNLFGLFASRASNPWFTPWDAHARLMTKYRELASRELGLGRYRRAAYIFAHLLNDLASAANALRQGKYFREAAVLYRDRLKDLNNAAHCLEEGGLLVEAIELYQQLKQHEKVGDLYRRLRQDADADAAYRRAVEHHRELGQRLRAAHLLEDKLRAPDEALEVLTGGWPYGGEAAQCLTESFALLNRLSRHEEAQRRVVTLRRELPREPRHFLPLANVLATVAGTYANTDVRRVAADATRVVAGTRLADASTLGLEMSGLVDAVARADFADRLLRRDGQRFVEQRAQKPVVRPKPQAAPVPRATSAKPPELVRAFHLGQGAQWRTAVATRLTFYAQGFRESEAVVVHSTWEGHMEHVAWPDRSAGETRYRLEQVNLPSPTSPKTRSAKREHGVIVLPFGAPESMYWTTGKQLVSRPGFARQNRLLDIRADEHGILWFLHGEPNEEMLLVSATDLAGNLLSSQTVSLPVPELRSGEGVAFTELHVRAGQTCVIAGDVMQLLARQKELVKLSGPAVSAAVSPPHVRFRLAVCFAEGGELHWPLDGRSQHFGQGLIDPVACILREGLLVVVGRQRGMIYEIRGFALHHLVTFNAMPAAPVAVMQTNNAAEFAVLYAGGLVRVLRLDPNISAAA